MCLKVEILKHQEQAVFSMGQRENPVLVKQRTRGGAQGKKQSASALEGRAGNLVGS